MLRSTSTCLRLVGRGPTQAQVREELAREEAQSHARGDITRHQISPAVWLITGLELEETWYLFHFLSMNRL